MILPTASCPALSHPEFGSVTVTKAFQNFVAIFNCNTGFGLFGTPLLTCQNGTWSDKSPVCKRKHSCFTICTLLFTSISPASCPSAATASPCTTPPPPQVTGLNDNVNPKIKLCSLQGMWRMFEALVVVCWSGMLQMEVLGDSPTR